MNLKSGSTPKWTFFRSGKLAEEEAAAGRRRACCYSDHHPCNGKGRSVTRRRACDGEADGGEGPVSRIRPPRGEHTPCLPCMTGCHIIGLVRLCTTSPPGAAGRCFMYDLRRSWKSTGMSWAANKVSSIDRRLNVVTCLAQRLMGNNRLALWESVSCTVSVAGCCLSSYCHSRTGA